MTSFEFYNSNLCDLLFCLFFKEILKTVNSDKKVFS